MPVLRPLSWAVSGQAGPGKGLLSLLAWGRGMTCDRPLLSWDPLTDKDDRVWGLIREDMDPSCSSGIPEGSTLRTALGI